MWQAGSRITLMKTSEVGQRNWGYEKMRHQLQIYAPPLDHCTSLKPEGGSSGSVSIPAHTGRTRPPTCWFISAVFLNVFPHPERWKLIRFTHVCQEIHFGGKRNIQFIWGKGAPLAPVSCLKPHSTTDPRQEGRIGDGCSPLHCLWIYLRITGCFVLWLFHLTLSWHCSLCYMLSFVVCHCFSFHVNSKVTVAFKG